MLCVNVFVCMCVCVCVCVCLCACVYAAVIHPPKSQVALPETVINYECQGGDNIDLFLNDTIVLNSNEALLSIGISFTYTSSLGIFGRFNITIIASVLNNETSVYCLDTDGKSLKVYIYTVEGKSRHSEEGC